MAESRLRRAVARLSVFMGLFVVSPNSNYEHVIPRGIAFSARCPRRSSAASYYPVRSTAMYGDADERERKKKNRRCVHRKRGLRTDRVGEIATVVEKKRLLLRGSMAGRCSKICRTRFSARYEKFETSSISSQIYFILEYHTCI